MIFEPVRGIPCRRLNACPVPFPDFVNGGGGAVGGGGAWRRGAARQAALHQDSAGRGEWSPPVSPVYPGDHWGLFPRGDLGWGWLGRVSLGGLEQAELAGTGDRRGAVLNAQFAVQGALVGLHGVQ